jgi:hypothetical protein
LNAVNCGHPNVSTSTVTLGVTPGIVDAWIGNVSEADLNNFTTKPNPPPAVLASLGAVTVFGLAHAGMGNTTPKSVTFDYPDIQSQTPQTVTTTNFTQSLTSSLLGNLALPASRPPEKIRHRPRLIRHKLGGDVKGAWRMRQVHSLPAPTGKMASNFMGQSKTLMPHSFILWVDRRCHSTCRSYGFMAPVRFLCFMKFFADEVFG